MSKEENPWARTVEPTVEQTNEAHRPRATRETHPAYAVIQANRVSGSTALFQSDFRHNGYIKITIAKADVTRDLSTDWVHSSGRDELIEISLSEAQWASFLSCMNVGVGTPCTLVHQNREPVPGIARPKNRHEQFKVESADAIMRAKQQLDQLRATIRAAGLSKKKEAEMLSSVDMAERGIGSTQNFVAERFAEHVETTVEHGKAEVAGYINGAVRHLGMLALAEGKSTAITPLILEFQNGKD